MPQQEAETTPTLERIREAAIELFGENGYDGTSMSQLADRVGIAKPSLYNYYRSKEELLLDLVEAGLEQWIAQCQPPFERKGSYEELLRDHVLAMIDFARRNPQLVGVFHLASAHVQGELAARVEEITQRHLEPFRCGCHERLQEAIADGEIEERDAEAIDAFLGVFFQGLLFQQTACPQDAEAVVRHLPAVWRMLFRAISGRDPVHGLPDAPEPAAHMP
jgi:AcrR family transcriptional regulator